MAWGRVCVCRTCRLKSELRFRLIESLPLGRCCGACACRRAQRPSRPHVQVNVARCLRAHVDELWRSGIVSIFSTPRVTEAVWARSSQSEGLG